MFQKAFVLLLPLLSLNCFSDERIVYGEDNREETFQSNVIYQEYAKSTAGMIDTIKLIDLGSHFMLPPSSLGSDYGLCDGERFKDQPSPLACSGFLVGEDLLVTAGHCVRTQKDCDNVSWVFDFAVLKNTGKANVAISKDKVFSCSKVIEARLEGRGPEMRDYALIKLNKSPMRKALAYRESGKINKGEKLVLIGHPSGLPQKIATNGEVVENESEFFFKTNLDSFGGNSGSAVFNEKTGLVEGILVRGATDYVTGHCGTRVNRVQQNIEGKERLGESVSRIGDIEALKVKKSFFDFFKSGSAEKIVELIKNKPYVLWFKDSEGNTPLHLSIGLETNRVLKTLVSLNSIDMNLKNNDGQTALHLAASQKKIDKAIFLIKNGADALIRNNDNKRASDLLELQ